MTGADILIGNWQTGEPPVISTEETLPNGKVGEAFSFQFEASHSEDAVWTARDTPAGLTLSPDGLLSGVPTSSGNHVIRITVTNATGKDVRNFNLTVIPAAPKFDATQVIPDAFDGIDYKRFYLTASGESKTFEITSGELPPGMAFSRSGGSIYGTPVGYGLFTFTVTVSNPGGSDSREFTLNLNSDYPYITTSSFPVLTKDEHYTLPLAGSGPSSTYALVSGDLPTGMSLNTSTGVITGRARSHGIATFTISKTNALGSVTKDFSMDVRYVAPTLDATYFSTLRKGVDYSYQIAGTGEGVTYAITEGLLPAGLTLDPTSGRVSGSALEVGDFTFTVRKTNESGTVSRSYTLNSLLVAPRIPYNTRIPDGYMDFYYEHQIVATGEEIVWTATNLPDGLSINSATGVISGTPTVMISKYISIKATNGGGSSTENILITVRSPLPEILTTSMPEAEVGTPYSATFEAVGYGVTTRVSSTYYLPPGLSYNDKTGVLSGTPTKSGTYNMTFLATTSGGSVSQVISLVIDKDFPTITTITLERANQLVRYTTTPLGGVGEGSTYSITDGIMPPGMSISSGSVIGTPNTNAHGSYTFTVTKTNSRGSVSQEFTIDVMYQAPTLTSPETLAQIRMGRAYSYALLGVGNGSTYTVIEGALPEGVTLDSSTGILTGTATVTGDFAFTIQKANESGTVSKEYTLKVIHVTPVLVTTSLDRATIGVPYSMQLKATGLDIVYSISSGTLPAGLTLDPNTGIISGTPTVTGTTNIRVSVTNSGGHDYYSPTFYVDEVAPTMITTSLPSGKVNDPYYAKIEGTGEAIVYSISLGSLPSGLTLNASTGEITGTPTTAVVSNIAFRVRNSGGTATQLVPMTIITQAPTIDAEILPDGTRASAYSHSLGGEGTSNTFTITDGALPPGITINSSGTVRGTPTTRGTYTFTVAKTNVSGSVSKEFTLKIAYILPTLQTASGPFTTVAVGNKYTLSFGGGGDAVTYSITEGELPPGLGFAANGNLTGTPTTAGDYAFTLRKWNLDGEVSRSYTMKVLPG